MDWQKLENVEVGTNRFADGEWRVIEDEMAITLEVKSNGLGEKMTVPSILPPDAYPIIAELLIKGMNSVEPK